MKIKSIEELLIAVLLLKLKKSSLVTLDEQEDRIELNFMGKTGREYKVVKSFGAGLSYATFTRNLEMQLDEDEYEMVYKDLLLNLNKEEEEKDFDYEAGVGGYGM